MCNCRHNGLPSHTSALPGADVGYVPAVSQTGPHPGHNPLLAHHHHAPATANSGQLPPGVLQHANGTDGLRGPDSRSSSAHPLGQTASLSPSLGELDSGYTGSERPSLTLRQYASPHQPLRSSTGSELAPIASQSSLATNVNPLSSSTSYVDVGALFKFFYKHCHFSSTQCRWYFTMLQRLHPCNHLTPAELQAGCLFYKPPIDKESVRPTVSCHAVEAVPCVEYHLVRICDKKGAVQKGGCTKRGLYKKGLYKKGAVQKGGCILGSSHALIEEIVKYSRCEKSLTDSLSVTLLVS